MPRRRPRPYRTTYDLPSRRRPVRMVWLGLAAVLGVVLAFGGVAVVSRAISRPAAPVPQPVTSTVSPPAATPTIAGTAGPSPTVTAVGNQVDDAVITGVAGRFVDAWLQRDRAKRKTQLAQTANGELALALMRTDAQNIPRIKKNGAAVIDSRAEGVAIVLQPMTDPTVLRITVVMQPGSPAWLASNVDLPAA